MVLDSFNVVATAIVVAVYGLSCGASALFSFFPLRYERLEEQLGMVVVPTAPMTPLDIPIVSLHEWLCRQHRVVGPVLIILSLWDMWSLAGIMLRMG